MLFREEIKTEGREDDEGGEKRESVAQRQSNGSDDMEIVNDERGGVPSQTTKNYCSTKTISSSGRPKKRIKSKNVRGSDDTIW